MNTDIKRKTICLIDDDDVYKYALSKLIRLHAFAEEVLQFANGAEALQFLLNAADSLKVPDIILLDIDMPVLDGWQFLEEYARIKEKIRKKIMIYMVSSSSNDKDIERATRSADVTDYIIKPLTSERLADLFR